MSSSIEKAYWHIHHDILMEFATEPIRNRRKFIRKHKSYHEMETRLRLIRPVKGSLPRVVIKAGAARVKAWVACEKARVAYYKAKVAYVKARVADDKAWAAYTEARVAYETVGAAYAKAYAAYTEARVAYFKVLKDNKAEIEALHAKECPNCPWDGDTIFPKG